MACGHAFHEYCIDTWAHSNGLPRNSARCPECRHVGVEPVLDGGIVSDDAEVGAAATIPVGSDEVGVAVPVPDTLVVDEDEDDDGTDDEHDAGETTPIADAGAAPEDEAEDEDGTDDERDVGAAAEDEEEDDEDDDVAPEGAAPKSKGKAKSKNEEPSQDQVHR